MSKFGFITYKQASQQIRRALNLRSTVKWSVRTMRGTGYGWIQVTVAPSHGDPNRLTAEQVNELARLFNLPSERVGNQGITIRPDDDFYQEYIDRAEGREPIVIGVPTYSD